MLRDEYPISDKGVVEFIKSMLDEDSEMLDLLK